MKTNKLFSLAAIADVNDFGRILEGLENGIKFCKDINLAYFIDKGWKANWQTTIFD